MKFSFNDFIQWAGVLFIVSGQVLNAIGPGVYPWNIVIFCIGAGLFCFWAFRVKNMPQIVVNIITILVGVVGLIKAWS